MRTRNSNFPNNSPVTIPRRRNRRRAPNVVEPELRTIVEVAPMAERTMEELLRAPTEGYGEAIVIPEINADHFEIKTNLLQLVQASPFHGFEREKRIVLIFVCLSVEIFLRFWKGLVLKATCCGALEEGTGFKDNIAVISFGIGFSFPGILKAPCESSNESLTYGIRLPLSTISIGSSTKRRFSSISISSKGT
ncbi:hypothetical protein Tco_0492910 [Tanacetum coccineum]